MPERVSGQRKNGFVKATSDPDSQFCAVTLEDGTDCSAPVSLDAPINLCEHHIDVAHAWRRDNPTRVAVRTDDDCPLCGAPAMYAGRAGAMCAMCGYKTPDHVAGDELPRALRMLPLVPRGRRRDNPTPVVYYLAFGDRIKIGTSTHLRKRLLAVPHDEVLAIERGGETLERRRHEQFAHARLTGEWFARDPKLLDHIASLQTGRRWSVVLGEWETVA